MPRTHSVVTHFGLKLNDVHKNSDPWRLLPGGKTLATIEHAEQANGFVELRKIHAATPSQHAEPLKAPRTKKVARYSGPKETALGMEDMTQLIKLKVFRETFEAHVLVVMQRQVLTIQTRQTTGYPTGSAHRQDPTKADWSAGHICRLMGKSIVKSGLSKRCSAQMSHENGAVTSLSLSDGGDVRI